MTFGITYLMMYVVDSYPTTLCCFDNIEKVLLYKGLKVHLKHEKYNQNILFVSVILIMHYYALCLSIIIKLVGYTKLTISSQIKT